MPLYIYGSHLLNTYPSVIENKGSLLWADEKDTIDDFSKINKTIFLINRIKEKFDIEIYKL